MTEKIPNQVATVDVQYIYNVREKMNALIAERPDDFVRLQEHIIKFDAQLKQYTQEKLGSTAWLQQVDVWQALIGGSVEEKADVTEEFYRDICQKISNFVVQLHQSLEGDFDASEINYDF